MLNDKEELISILQANIFRLKNLYETEKEAHLILEKERTELSAKLQQKEVENETLETKINTLKLAKSLSGGNNDMHDAKTKVTNLVREIDKCIALLNR
jgi:hypothetical protein